MTKKLLLLSICCIVLGIAGCGQNGDLYLPKKQHQSESKLD